MALVYNGAKNFYQKSALLKALSKADFLWCLRLFFAFLSYNHFL